MAMVDINWHCVLKVDVALTKVLLTLSFHENIVVDWIHNLLMLLGRSYPLYDLL